MDTRRDKQKLSPIKAKTTLKLVMVNEEIYMGVAIIRLKRGKTSLHTTRFQLIMQIDNRDLDYNALRIIKNDCDYLVIVGYKVESNLREDQAALLLHLMPFISETFEELTEALREEAEEGIDGFSLNGITIGDDYQRLDDNRLTAALLVACTN